MPTNELKLKSSPMLEYVQGPYLLVTKYVSMRSRCSHRELPWLFLTKQGKRSCWTSWRKMWRPSWWLNCLGKTSLRRHSKLQKKNECRNLRFNAFVDWHVSANFGYELVWIRDQSGSSICKVFISWRNFTSTIQWCIAWTLCVTGCNFQEEDYETPPKEIFSRVNTRAWNEVFAVTIMQVRSDDRKRGF